MRKIVFIMLFLIVGVAKSQVGVGTPFPNNSAQLDIVSSDKGMLIPRLALSNSTDAVNITGGNVLSLLVFNIAKAGDLTPGFHYWDGNKWQRLTNTDDLMTIIDNVTDVLIDNQDGTFTHTASDGTLTTFDANTTTIVDNGAGTYIITNDNGNTITLDVIGDVVTNIQNQGDIYDEIITVITANETLTVLGMNADGINLDYQDEDGNITQIDLSAVITANETLTTLVDNGDNTVTYTDEAGVATIIDLATIVDNAETLTILGLNADGINLDYQDEDGVITQIDLAAVIAANETLTVLGMNADGINLDYQDEDGNTKQIDLSAVIAANETLTVLGMNADGINLDYLDEDGNTTQIDVSTLVDNLETLTLIGMNADGINLDYQDEDGVITQVDLAAVIAANEALTVLGMNADGINLDYLDEDGNTTQVNLTALEPWFDQANIGVGANLNTQDLYTMGRVAIGQNAMFGVPANEMLAVSGSIRTATSVYADYVFEDYLDGASIIKKDYNFKTLEEVDTYIKANKHLPGVTSINDLVKTETGDYSFNLSELSVQLLEKVEELYLHTIEQQKELEAKNAKIEALEVRLTKIEAALNLNYKN